MLRKGVDNATQSLLRESVVPQLSTQSLYSCGGSTGWRRVAYLNMSDPSQQCPSVWQELTTPHWVCGRTSSTGGCEGLNYTTGSVQYDQVCGRMIGYQIGNTQSFVFSSGRSINTNYVDGISVTHGSPRQHIWTFAAGLEDHYRGYHGTCPCVTGSTVGSLIPSFVGQDYFCESGLTQYPPGTGGDFYPDGDPLWDGQGCGPTTLPLTYPGQLLQGNGSQTCPSEERREMFRNEIKNATQSLLRESVVPQL